MTNSNRKKATILGMPFGTASGRLRKKILFHLLKKHNENFCFRCKEYIEREEELSIEHKIAWLNNNVDLFWDIENIAFSHLTCNVKASVNPNKGIKSHPSQQAYKEGCRCDECRNIEKIRRREQRAQGINT